MSAGRERLEDGGGDGRRAKERKIDHRQGALRLIARAIPVFNPGSLLSYDAPAAPLAGEEDQTRAGGGSDCRALSPSAFFKQNFLRRRHVHNGFYLFPPSPSDSLCFSLQLSVAFSFTPQVSVWLRIPISDASRSRKGRARAVRGPPGRTSRCVDFRSINVDFAFYRGAPLPSNPELLVPRVLFSDTVEPGRKISEVSAERNSNKTHWKEPGGGADSRDPRPSPSSGRRDWKRREQVPPLPT